PVYGRTRPTLRSPDCACARSTQGPIAAPAAVAAAPPRNLRRVTAFISFLLHWSVELRGFSTTQNTRSVGSPLSFRRNSPLPSGERARVRGGDDGAPPFLPSPIQPSPPRSKRAHRLEQRPVPPRREREKLGDVGDAVDLDVDALARRRRLDGRACWLHALEIFLEHTIEHGKVVHAS